VQCQTACVKINTGSAALKCSNVENKAVEGHCEISRPRGQSWPETGEIGRKSCAACSHAAVLCAWRSHRVVTVRESRETKQVKGFKKENMESGSRETCRLNMSSETRRAGMAALVLDWIHDNNRTLVGPSSVKAAINARKADGGSQGKRKCRSQRVG
jgi:hypothetical protein